MPQKISLLIPLVCAAVTSVAAASPCGRALADTEIRLSPPRALTLPLQLGFATEAGFARAARETRAAFLDHLGPGGRGRDWALALDSIYPATTLVSIATFTATHHRNHVPAPHAPEPERRGVRVHFNPVTGELRQFEVADAGFAPAPENVRLVRSVEGEIERLTHELTRRLQGGDYASADNAARAATHRRLRIGRTFSAANRSTIWIEVHLKILTETAGGGLIARAMNLVYAISPNQHVHLRAADDPDVVPLIGL